MYCLPPKARICALMDEEKTRKLGIDAYVMNPIDLVELSKTICSVLDSR